MVVGEPDRIALLAPVADCAVVDRVWVGLGGSVDVLEEAGAQAADVRVEVLQTQTLALARPKHDLDVRGLATLRGGEQLAVQRELHHEVRLDVTRQLGIDRLVGPRA